MCVCVCVYLLSCVLCVGDQWRSGRHLRIINNMKTKDKHCLQVGAHASSYDREAMDSEIFATRIVYGNQIQKILVVLRRQVYQ